MGAALQVGTVWNPGLMSSLRGDWATPRILFEVLDREFHFGLDVCAGPEIATCVEWFGAGALERSWIPTAGGAVWCNPPYGREIGRWIQKGYQTAREAGQTVVMLLPARTDTQWFHAYCLRGEIRFLRGRLHFDDLKANAAPFPSMIVVFRP